MGNPADITPYTYNATWKDKLAAYNGQAITSDAIGNTLNDGTWTYYWEMGRRLWQMEKGNYGAPNSVLMNFNYNAEGIRIGKLCDSHDASGNNSYVYTDYYVHGKKIMHMTQSNNNLHFFYDAQGRPAVVNYNGTKYAYILNLQGDVLGLRNSSGTEVVKYTYDAWGKILSTTGSMASSLGKLNPFRYRGYVYDEETGLYYLQSRYYNPEWGRFINADIIIQKNLFTSCRNNPINLSDPNGKAAVHVTAIILNDGGMPKSFFEENIKPRIMEYLKSPTDYKYDRSRYKAAQYDEAGNIKEKGYTDCSHLMYEVTGQIGSYTAPYRYDEVSDDKKGRLFDDNGNLQVELVEGMEVYNEATSHVGMLMLYDFGSGLEWAVFQSASVKVNKSKALFSENTGWGPNITSFKLKNGDRGNWHFWTAPRFEEK